jgi:hypothetical protein
MAESWTRTVTVGGEDFEVRFLRRPFREGLQVTIVVHGKEISLGELGLGEQALLEAARVRIESILRGGSS